jgi:hypothetical protein
MNIKNYELAFFLGRLNELSIATLSDKEQEIIYDEYYEQLCSLYTAVAGGAIENRDSTKPEQLRTLLRLFLIVDYKTDITVSNESRNIFENICDNLLRDVRLASSSKLVVHYGEGNINMYGTIMDSFKHNKVTITVLSVLVTATITATIYATLQIEKAIEVDVVSPTYKIIKQGMRGFWKWVTEKARNLMAEQKS